MPVILNRASGVLRGHAQIREFLEKGTRRRPNELVRWHRDKHFLNANGLLVWEYPRATPQSEQIDILVKSKKFYFRYSYLGAMGI